MEQNPGLDPSSQQFRQQLNQWFEQHGVLDNLRSHLRSVMVTALQQTEIRLRPNQKTTPKMQSVNLLVAEYLIKHGCHYTLSVLMSELPALSNFASGAVLFRCRPKAVEKSKSREKYRFQENEVVEILNSLGVSSNDENLRMICECYNRNKEEESLLECLLRFIPKLESKRITERCGAENGNEAWGDAQVGDVMKNIHHVTVRHLLSKMSDGELKRAVEEENERRTRELIEREKRIQDYLKSHEDEMVERLRSAERELTARQETIDRELNERQLHLGRIALQLKDKHNEIVELSRNFAAIKSENVALSSKLDSVQIELNELREELEKKTEIIERLEAERMSMKCHVQAYLKWKSRGGMDREAVTSNFHDGMRRRSAEMEETSRSVLNGENKEAVKSDSSEGGSPSSDESCGEALLDRVKARVEELDQENARISEKYSKYKTKFDVGEWEINEAGITVPDARVTVAEASVAPAERVGVIVIDKQVETCQECPLPENPEPPAATPRKKMPVEEEKRAMIPTKRQQKNLEYFLQSRSLLEALEKSTGSVDESESGSTSDNSLCRSLSRLEIREGADNPTAQGNLPRGTESGRRHLSDLECLTLLKEATRPSRDEQTEVTVSSLPFNPKRSKSMRILPFQTPVFIGKRDEGG